MALELSEFNYNGITLPMDWCFNHNGKCFALTTDFSNTIIMSTDLISWKSLDSEESYSFRSTHCLCVHNHIFIYTGFEEDGEVAFTQDFKNNSQISLYLNSTHCIRDIFFYNNDYYIATDKTIYTSNNLKKFDQIDIGKKLNCKILNAGSNSKNICYLTQSGKSKKCNAIFTNDNNSFQTSEVCSGTDFMLRAVGDFYYLKYSDNKFNKNILFSEDCMNWHEFEYDILLETLCLQDDIYFVYTSDGDIIASDDGKDWTELEMTKLKFDVNHYENSIMYYNNYLICSQNDKYAQIYSLKFNK